MSPDSVSAGINEKDQTAMCPPSMLTPKPSLLEAEVDAFEVTSVCKVTLYPEAIARYMLSRFQTLEKHINANLSRTDVCRPIMYTLCRSIHNLSSLCAKIVL